MYLVKSAQLRNRPSCGIGPVVESGPVVGPGQFVSLTYISLKMTCIVVHKLVCIVYTTEDDIWALFRSATVVVNALPWIPIHNVIETWLLSVKQNVLVYSPTRANFLFSCDNFRWTIASIPKPFSRCLLAQPRWRPMRIFYAYFNKL